VNPKLIKVNLDELGCCILMKAWHLQSETYSKCYPYWWFSTFEM